MVQKEDYSNYFQNPRTKLIKWRKKFSYMYIIPRTIYISMRRWWCSSCSRPILIRSNGFYTVLTLSHQSVVTHGTPHYHVSEQTRHFSYSLWARKYQFQSLIWPDRGLNPRSTRWEAITLIIVPPMWYGICLTDCKRYLIDVMIRENTTCRMLLRVRLV